MKVGMLTSARDQCGIAVYSAHLAEGLRGIVDLSVVPIWDQAAPWDEYLAESSKALNAADVVHIQHEYSFWGSVLPGQNKFFDQVSAIKRPIVMTAHTLDPAAKVLGLDLPGAFARKAVKRLLSQYPPYRRVIERDTFRVADRTIIHDPDAAAKLERRGIPKDRIRIIPMGVPAADLTPGAGDAFRARFGVEGRRLIVIFGFVRPGRGYEAAMDILPSLGDDVTLVIAGGPQTDMQRVYMDSLAEQVRARGLGGRVVITGYLPDDMVSGAMQAADVVLCSQEVGTGSYSVQVALAYGRPVVASDLPCFTYPEQTHGCLVTFERGDAQNMAAKLHAVLDGRCLSADLSAKALRYAAEHTWARIAQKTLEVYRELM